MRCSDCIENLDLYIDNMLDEAESEKMKSHIISCESCKREYEELSSIISCLNELECEPLPEGFDNSLRMRLESEKAAVMPEKEKRFAVSSNLRKLTYIAASIIVIMGGYSLYKGIYDNEVIPQNEIALTQNTDSNNIVAFNEEPDKDIEHEALESPSEIIEPMGVQEKSAKISADKPDVNVHGRSSETEVLKAADGEDESPDANASNGEVVISLANEPPLDKGDFPNENARSFKDKGSDIEGIGKAASGVTMDIGNYDGKEVEINSEGTLVVMMEKNTKKSTVDYDNSAFDFVKGETADGKTALHFIPKKLGTESIGIVVQYEDGTSEKFTVKITVKEPE